MRKTTILRLVGVAILVVLGLAICGIRFFGVLLRENQALIRSNLTLERTNAFLSSRVTDLSDEASRWKNKAEENQARLEALTAKASRAELAADARTGTADILDFHSEVDSFQPPTIQAAYPRGQNITQKSMEESRRYQEASIAAFLKRFGGPISGIIRRAKPFGIDTSRLQRHMDAMVNTLMMKLVAEDLADIAEQLDPSPNRQEAEPRQSPPPARPESPKPKQQFTPDIKSIMAMQH